MLHRFTVRLNSVFASGLTLASLSGLDRFLQFNILYAIRNNTLHGKIASRLNSKTANGKSFRASKYIYLLGYMFLSIMLYVSNELELNDLSFNFENIKYLK